MTLLAAALAGFAVLVVEILGVHLLAPWFGASTVVWSQQIGLVLGAIALGGWLGGRRAAVSPDPRRDASWCLLVGGLLVVLCAFGLAPFAMWMLPEGLTLDQAAAVFGRGSILAALIFYVPPVLFLSMVSPLLVQIRAAEQAAGRAAGEVSCAGTVGSLLGVLFAVFIAVPVLGVRTTLALMAVVLFAASFLLRSRGSTVGAAALPLLLLLTPDLAARANLPEGAEVLAVAESSYQHLRVVGFEDGTRWLQMNEGLDSYQSLWRPDGGWSGGYYDLFALAPLYAEPSSDGGPVAAWILGYGAGTAVQPLAAATSALGVDLEVTGLELDPVVEELAAEWMPLPAREGVSVRAIGGADARALLRTAAGGLDLILLDAYARQFEIPLHLATEEFFAEVHAQLRDGGVFALNLGTATLPDPDSGLLGAIRAAVGASFGAHLRLQRVPYSRNWMLFARRGKPLPPLDSLGERLPAGWPLALGAACLPGQVVEGLPDGEAVRLLDQRNPLGLQQLLDWSRGGGG